VSVTLFIQNAKRMRHIILSSVDYLVLPYFSTLSRKWHDVRKKKVIGQEMVVLFSLQISPEIYLILRRTGQDIIINVYRSSYTCQILMTFKFLDRPLKNSKCEISRKSVLWQLSCLYADRQTDCEANVTVRNFANAPEM